MRLPSDEVVNPTAIAAGEQKHPETRVYTVAKSGGYETQVSAYGPLGISYINPSDDPSNTKTK